MNFSLPLPINSKGQITLPKHLRALLPKGATVQVSFGSVSAAPLVHVDGPNVREFKALTGMRFRLTTQELAYIGQRARKAGVSAEIVMPAMRERLAKVRLRKLRQAGRI